MRNEKGPRLREGLDRVPGLLAVSCDQRWAIGT